MSLGYDNQPINHQILLDLPFEEGVGAITRDLAKPHHEDVLLIATPTWDETDSGVGTITFDGATEYLELDQASCADLDFTTEDYSIGMWFYWTVGNPTLMLMGRNQVDVGGWELYLYDGGGADRILTLRHNHAAGAAVRSACNSTAWTRDTWWFVGVSRSGNVAPHYRNGKSITTNYGVGGLEDMETCAQDLVVGARYTKDANFYCGSMYRPRIWDRALTATEWAQIFEMERHWFGV